MKTFPLPDMSPSVGWLERFFLPTVHAQMSPTGSGYTTMSLDSSGNLHATGVTNATSSCHCHQASATTAITYPNGGGTYAQSLNQVETAVADASFALYPDTFQYDSGNISARTTHTALCPIMHISFDNISTTAVGTSRLISAYYMCTANCQTNAPTYTRCNIGDCNTINEYKYNRPVNFSVFALFNVAFLNLPGGTEVCLGGAPTYTDKCHSPDPKP
jgi:hypothetical protein